MTVINTNKPQTPNDGEFARTKGKVEAFGLTIYSPNGKALLDQAAACDVKKDLALLLTGAAAADASFWHARNICGNRESTLEVVIQKLDAVVAAVTQTNTLIQQQMMAAQVQAGVQAALAAAQAPAPAPAPAVVVPS